MIGVEFKQQLDLLLMDLKETVLSETNESFFQGKIRVLRHQGRFCVPDSFGLRELIMEKAHNSRQSIHLAATMIYRDLQEIYSLNGIKKDNEFCCYVS